ncbi:MAG: hypothetical protein M0D55_02560 [Elusimicrobiota bacterium]|nr:MAG: hypothetical protein M0D55_02560 [Elusimicrobiota bacterium]
MYYLPAVSSGAPHASSGPAILSATSVDGFAWTKEAGVRVDTNTVPSVSASSITGASLQPLSGGGFRMLYSIVTTAGEFRIHSATSADGLAWANEATTHVDAGSVTFIGVPRLVVLNSGDWRMYYVRGSTTTLADRQILTALSTNQGAAWGRPRWRCRRSPTRRAPRSSPTARSASTTHSRSPRARARR